MATWLVETSTVVAPMRAANCRWAMAQHAQANIVKVDAAHLSMISHPQR
jgi:hypothetical protein